MPTTLLLRRPKEPYYVKRLRIAILVIFVTFTLAAILRLGYLAVTAPPSRLALRGKCEKLIFTPSAAKQWKLPLKASQGTITALTASGYQLSMQNDVTVIQNKKSVRAPDLRHNVGSRRISSLSVIPKKPQSVIFSGSSNDELAIVHHSPYDTELRGFGIVITVSDGMEVQGDGPFEYRRSKPPNQAISTPFTISKLADSPIASLVPQNLKRRGQYKQMPSPDWARIKWNCTTPSLGASAETRGLKRPANRTKVADGGSSVVLGTRRVDAHTFSLKRIEMEGFRPAELRLRGAIRDDLEKLKAGSITVEAEKSGDQDHRLSMVVERIEDDGIVISLEGQVKSLEVEGYNVVETNLQLAMKNRLAAENILDAILLVGWMGTFVLTMMIAGVKKLFGLD